MSDEKIISAIKNRDESAICYVMQKYSKLLWSVASAILANAATEDIEECVADVFIYLWQNPEKYSVQKGKLVSWLTMVARSKAIDRYRVISGRKESTLEEGMESRIEEIHLKKRDLLLDILEKEEKKHVWSDIQKLDKQDRDVIIRRYYYDQKPKEIALAFGVSKKQVENRLYQAKQKLKRVMTESDKSK